LDDSRTTGEKPMVYLVMGGEQVRSLREEREYPNGTARGSLGRLFEDACVPREKVTLFEGTGS
ncbi:MAG TPA: hypothetical protein VFY54_01865, partial [Rubrobacter sp.]|nr:hypothetical protein [Rubrobacter sp.]